MRARTTIAAAGALALLAAAPLARSQPEQTPEGALKFLRLTLPGSGIRWAGSDYQGRVQSVPEQPVGGGFRCRLPIEMVGTSTNDLAAISYNLTYWTQVDQVKQTSSTVSYSVRKPQSTIIFEFQSEATAARVAYAMEYLRQSCDPAADTGF